MRRIVILGAAGRDFHLFLTAYRDDPDVVVLAFTCAQIPFLEKRRTFPANLANLPLTTGAARYPEGIPITPEAELESLLASFSPPADEVVLAYSDLANEEVDALRRRVAESSPTTEFKRFVDDSELMAKSMLRPTTKARVLAITGVRTGVGKSQVSRAAMCYLTQVEGLKVVAMRHPMPYGDLELQAVQRFASEDDLAANKCTIEEREEYEPYVSMGMCIYAGVDFLQILAMAEEDENPDVILWDGGNNDVPFFQPDLWVCVCDPYRPGHEATHFPGGVNFDRADVLLINKVGTGPKGGVRLILQAAHERNPAARVVLCKSPPVLVREEPVSTIAHNDGRFLEVRPDLLVRGKRVLCVEDGPSVTHGGLERGAATIAALDNGASELVDPRATVVGSLRATFDAYGDHLGACLPAMGYSDEQVADLKATIDATPCDIVLAGTPIDLKHVLHGCNKPIVRVKYEVADVTNEEAEALRAFPPADQSIAALRDVLRDFAKHVHLAQAGKER